MPHCEIHRSSNLTIDAPMLLQLVEDIINQHDPKAGECKGRVYTADEYLHTHMLVRLSLLTKAHRDEAFTQALMADVENQLKQQLKQSCHFSLLLEYSPTYYVTNEHHIAGDPLTPAK